MRDARPRLLVYGRVVAECRQSRRHLLKHHQVKFGAPFRLRKISDRRQHSVLDNDNVTRAEASRPQDLSKQHFHAEQRLSRKQ